MPVVKCGFGGFALCLAVVAWEKFRGFRMCFGRSAWLLRWHIVAWDGGKDLFKQGEFVFAWDRRIYRRTKEGELPAEEMTRTILSANV